MDVAIVITARNEQRILRRNIEYHRHLGIKKFFIYLDNCSDDTRDSISDLDYVEVIESNCYAGFEGVDFFEYIYEQRDFIHTARQCLNTYDAKRKCKEQGIDWLISIDADELVVFNKERCEKNHAINFFEAIGDSCDEVGFKVHEVLSRKLHYVNVFAEETLFKSKDKFLKKTDVVQKKTYDPFNCKMVNISFWFGHSIGKSAIRVKSGLIPKSVHRYVSTSQSPHKKIYSGFLLHYHAYDIRDFKKKFTNFGDRPDVNLYGETTDYTKRLWRDVIKKFVGNESEISKYFSKYVLFSNKEICRMNYGYVRFLPFCKFQRHESALVEIKSVSSFFKD